MEVDSGASSGADELATLGVRVTSDGVEKVVTDFRGMAEQGEVAVEKLGAAGTRGATQFSNAFVESAGRTRQVLETQLGTLTAITQGWGTASAQARDIGTKLAASIEAEGRMAQATAAQVKQLADAEARMATLSDADQAALRRQIGAQEQAIAEDKAREASTRRLALAQAEAIAIDEKRNGTIAGSASGFGKLAASLQHTHPELGRLEHGLAAVAGQALGSIPVLDRVGTILLTQSVGGVVGFAVIAGLAAIALGYEKLTEESRKAKEEQEKLTSALHNWYVEQQAGPAGKLVAEIAAVTAKVKELQATLDHAGTTGNAPFLVQLKAQIAGLLAGGDPLAQEVAIVNSIRKWFADQTAAINQGSLEREAAMKAANEKIVAAIKDAQAAEITALSSTISGGRATPADTRLGASLIEDYQRQLRAAEQSAPPPSSGEEYRKNLEKRADLLGRITSLTDAQATADQKYTEVLKLQAAEQQRVIDANTKAADAYTKNVVAVAKLTAETQASRQVVADKITLLQTEGIEHDRLANHLEIEAQKRKLVVDILSAETVEQAQALIVRRDALDALEKLNDRYIILSASAKQAAQAQKDFTDSAKAVAKIGAENTKLGRDQIDAAANAIKAQQKYLDDMRAIFREGFSKIVTDGFKSFNDFFEDVLRLSTRLMQRMEQQGKTSGLGYQLLGLGSAAIGGGIAGYNIGQSTASTAGGLLGGAAAGAIGGSSFGPWGAVIGGLTGAAGGLLGASAAQQKAAEQLRQAAEAFQIKESAYVAGASGNAVQSAIATATATRDALLAEARNVYKDPQEYSVHAQAINTATNTRLDRISTDFWGGITAGLNSLKGPAGEYENIQAAIKKSYEDNIASADAIAKANGRIGISDEERARILELEKGQLDAAAAAEQRRIDTLRENYTERGLRAQGRSAEADAAAFNFQQQHEMSQALADHMDPLTLALLANTQVLEAVAFAAEQLQKALEQNVSDIQRDLNLGFITRDQAKAAEAQQFGFGGLTDEQIRAKYTPFTGTALTQQQETDNNNIAKFFQDFPELVQSLASGTAGARAASGGERNALVNAAQALTEATGNRMADYEASQLIELRAIRKAIEAKGGSVFSGSVNGLQPVTPSSLSNISNVSTVSNVANVSSVSNVSNLPPQPNTPTRFSIPTPPAPPVAASLPNLIAPPLNFAPAPTPSADLLSAWFERGGRSAPANSPTGASGSPVATAPAVSFTNTFTITIAQTDGEDSVTLAKRVAEEVQKIMDSQAKTALLRSGDPIKLGS